MTHDGTPQSDRPAPSAAALFAVDPAGLGGIALRSPAGAARDDWLGAMQRLMPEDAPWRRIPIHVDDDRLLGGLDLTATLTSGTARWQRGLLAEADGGVVVLAMAERLATRTVTHTAAVLDARVLVIERHGFSERRPCRIGVVALDEGLDDDEGVAPALRERLAFRVVLGGSAGAAGGVCDGAGWERSDLAAARARLHDVLLSEAVVEGLCATALAVGIGSMRAPLLACRAACAAAALAGRTEVDAQDAALAAALVLAHRARCLPADEAGDDDAADDGVDEPASGAEPQAARDAQADLPPPAPPHVDADGPGDASGEDQAAARSTASIEDRLLEATIAAIPPGLLAALTTIPSRNSAQARAGGAGTAQGSALRGRPVGTRRGELRGGARLHLIDTLRQAAPWQGWRRREAPATGRDAVAKGIQLRPQDVRLCRYRQRSETTTVFVVDASGSSALHRLAEAKGAVELLLADCYVRRDSVAVIAFRGRQADLLLPPTRSLTRAKRSLAGLPGGGGTPLAAGLDSALALSLSIRRRGGGAVVVLLTDGRANVARDGTPGRARAGDEAHAAARQLRAAHIPALLIDTSPQPQESASRLARDMGGHYVPLPHAGAGALSQVVRAAAQADAAARPLR